jgi:pSer/pThr/pTyr-binding forkhead associated (FHA) protein
MSIDDSRIKELTAALQKAEQQLAERKTLITAAIGQTETARQQYEQANERAEALRRRLDAKEDQLSTFRNQLETAAAERLVSRETMAVLDQRVLTLQQELQQRGERIAALEVLYQENDNALQAINQDAKRQDLTKAAEQFASLGMMLESTDGHGVRHKISGATTTIGRSNGNDVVIQSASVSRYHARIVLESGGAFLIDLQSTNGCSVNGSRVSRQMLRDRDVISIGSAKFRLVAGVPSLEIEDRSMDETNALLDDAEIFSAVPRSKANASEAKPKAK